MQKLLEKDIRGAQAYHPKYRDLKFKNETEFGRWLSATAAYKITFKDEGQDCLVWYIDKHGEVLHAEPFQSGIWSGMCVDLSALKVGENVSVVANHLAPKKKYTTFDFVVVKIEKTYGKRPKTT